MKKMNPQPATRNLPARQAGPKSKMQRWLRRIPLTTKTVVATLVVGLVVWVVLDFIESHRLKGIFKAQLVNKLGQQAEQDRLMFHRNINTFHKAVKLFVKQKSFSDYTEKQKWSAEDAVTIKYHRRPPEWSPELSVQRSFVHARYFLLLDPYQRVREVYHSRRELPPTSLLKPSRVMFSKSHNQTYMTTIGTLPYILTAESLVDSAGRLQATLMLASPINDELLISFLGTFATGQEAALLTPGDNPEILSSTNLEELPPGMPVKELEGRYLMTGKGFFDYGGSDLVVNLASFISNAEVDFLFGAVVKRERQLHAIMAVVFILVFSSLMYWVARRVQAVTRSISDFSQLTLGVSGHEIEKGDQLHVLEERFQRLTGEIIEAREIIKRQAEEKTRLIVNNAFDAIIAMDAKGVITTWNPQAEAIFGWTREEALGQKVVDTIVPLAYRRAHEVGLKNFLATGEGPILNMQIEIVACHRDGHEFPIGLSVSQTLEGEEYFFIAIIRDITERKKAEEDIAASLREKEVMLREIHHRVKNNMQVISSLLRLQSGQVGDQREAEMLKESQNRIKSMALIHEKLYQSRDMAIINFNSYISDLAKGLFRSYGVNADRVALKIDVKDILLGIDSAIPCGLIINELISNSLKYAFSETEKGAIQISLRKIVDLEMRNEDLTFEIVELTVNDNGIGIPEGLDFRNTESLGLQLVTTLSEDQLQGKIELNRAKGTEFRIRFKEVKYAERI